MVTRKGMGRGKGKGYSNITGKDPKVHSESAKGRKQPQRVSGIISGIAERQKILKKREAESIKDANKVVKEIAGDMFAIKRRVDKHGWTDYNLTTRDTVETILTFDRPTRGDYQIFTDPSTPINQPFWDSIPVTLKEGIIKEQNTLLEDLVRKNDYEIEFFEAKVTRPFISLKKIPRRVLITTKDFKRNNRKKYEKIREKIKG